LDWYDFDLIFLYLQIQKYILEINPTYDSARLLQAKIEFLSVVADYEHYIQLNLPGISSSKLLIYFFSEYYSR
jgi:hypothetical protein